MCLTIALVVAIDFERDMAASITNRAVSPCVSCASCVLLSKGENPINSLASSSTSFFKDSPKVFRLPIFDGDFSRVTTDSPTDASTGGG